MKIRSNYLEIICLSCMLLLTACGSETASDSSGEATSTTAPTETPSMNSTESPTETKATIVFFGNSLTAGYGLDEEQSFPSLIQNRIDSLGLNYKVVNAGLSGETSAGGLSRIDWILQQAIDVFVLELGGNDALRGFELSATRENLQGILDKVMAKYPDAQLVVAGMEAPPNMGEAYTNEFRAIYPELAEQNDAALIPFLLADVGGIPSLNLADGIHPNAEGQQIVRENIWAVLGTLVGE